jgi:tryptophanyl-tRNA synthetase
MEEQRKYGGNPDVDVAYTYLSYFLEDDAELEDLATKYRSGELLTGEMKQRCIAELQKFVSAFQERRSKVDDEAMRSFMRPKKLEYAGNPNPTKPVPAAPAAAAGGEGEGEGAGREDGKLTKGERKALKIAAQKAEKLALREKKEADKSEASAVEEKKDAGADAA